MKLQYWIIKDLDSHETIGIFEDDLDKHLSSMDIIKYLNEVIGDLDWRWNKITKAEFETYRVFGFNEFSYHFGIVK